MSRRRRQILVLTTFCLTLAFLFMEFRVAEVHGDSMLPTFHNGQLVLVTRFHRGPWQRGDVVLAKVGDDILIKRIAALPGDTIPLERARAFRHVLEFFDTTGDPQAPLRVPAGFVVVLGDNWQVSDDSRSFGPVAIKDILGSVVNAPSQRGVL